MEILVIGSEQNLLECQQKFGESHLYKLVENNLDAEALLKGIDVVFDFLISDQPKGIKIYNDFAGVAFLDSSKTTLNVLLSENNGKVIFFGFCGIPTFLNRKILEITRVDSRDQLKLQETCSHLNTDFAIVKDQVGMVTPRVICMIINEAYFAIKENISSRADIDLAMKLGTNYPFGPFEWAARIGTKNVYELLKAVYENAKDERYKICELLERESR